MSFAGHVMDMLKKQERNRQMRTSTRYHTRRQHARGVLPSVPKRKFRQADISAEERQRINIDLNAARRSEHRRAMVWTAIIFTILAASFVLFLLTL